MKRLLLIGAAAMLSLQTKAQEFDPTFDNDGWRQDTIGTGLGQSYHDIAVRTDNKVVACGLYDVTNFIQDVSVARYNANGTLDNSFGINGKVYMVLDAEGTVSSKVAVNAAGETFLAVAKQDGEVFFICKLTENGSFDNTFGTNGIKRDSLFAPGGGTANPFDIAIQADGKILITGGSYDANVNQSRGFIARYNANGTRDNTFGTDGVYKTVASGNGFNKILIQPDGKILAGGSTGNIPQQDWFIARVNADGTVDNTFGPQDGTQTIGMQYEEQVTDMDLQSDGSIIIGGACGNGNVTFRIVKLTANGFNDASFGTDVTSTTNWGYTPVELQTFTDHHFAGLAVLPDDKIVIGGTVDNFKLAVIRFKADGDPDNTFGTNSIVDSQLLVVNNMYMGSAAFDEATGRFYIAGRVYHGNEGINFSAVVAVNVAAPNSVKEIAGTKKLSIYPNPVSGVLHMESIEGDILIQDISGRTMLSAQGKDIDVSGLSTGMYFINCITKDGSKYTGQFVKN